LQDAHFKFSPNFFSVCWSSPQLGHFTNLHSAWFFVLDIFDYEGGENSPP